MKISCHAPILTLKGEQVLHPDGAKATFRSVAAEVLLARNPTDIDPNAPFRMYQLAQKLFSADFVDLNVEELALIKVRVGSEKAYNNLVIGRMWDILEGKSDTNVVGGSVVDLKTKQQGE